MKIIILLFIPLIMACSSTPDVAEVYYRDGFTTFEDAADCNVIKEEATLEEYTDTIYITRAFYNEISHIVKQNNDFCHNSNPLIYIKIGAREICIHKDGTTCCSDSADLEFVFKFKCAFGFYDMINKCDIYNSPEITKYGFPKNIVHLNSVKRERGSSIASPPRISNKKIMAICK